MIHLSKEDDSQLSRQEDLLKLGQLLVARFFNEPLINCKGGKASFAKIDGPLMGCLMAAIKIQQIL